MGSSQTEFACSGYPLLPGLGSRQTALECFWPNKDDAHCLTQLIPARIRRFSLNRQNRNNSPPLAREKLTVSKFEFYAC